METTKRVSSITDDHAMTHTMPNLDDLMIVDPSDLNPRELRATLRTANQQILMLVEAVHRYEKAISARDQIGTELHGFVDGVLKAYLRGEMGEVAKIANAYFQARPTYRERLEEDIEHAAMKGVH